MNLLSFIIYLPLQIAWIPLAVLGASWVAYRQIHISRRLAVSQTAVEILNGRWTMHVFGIRADEPSVRLARVLPNDSVIGLWLALFPLWLKYRISGRQFLYPRVPEPGGETLADLVIARTLYVDRLLEDARPHAEQFVVLGAGYDTRCYGSVFAGGMRCFEVDQPDVQAHKRTMLERAAIPSEHVQYVPVDFRHDDPIDALTRAGWDPSRPTLFLWEGVTLYLPEQAVRQMLARLRTRAAPGSRVVVDFYGERMIRWANRAAARRILEYTDEGIGFGLPFEADYDGVLSEFVASEGLVLREAFFLGAANKSGPYAVVAELVIAHDRVLNADSIEGPAESERE